MVLNKTYNSENACPQKIFFDQTLYSGISRLL